MDWAGLSGRVGLVWREPSSREGWGEASCWGTELSRGGKSGKGCAGEGRIVMWRGVDWKGESSRVGVDGSGPRRGVGRGGSEWSGTDRNGTDCRAGWVGIETSRGVGRSGMGCEGWRRIVG